MEESSSESEFQNSDYDYDSCYHLNCENTQAYCCSICEKLYCDDHFIDYDIEFCDKHEYEYVDKTEFECINCNKLCVKCDEYINSCCLLECKKCGPLHLMCCCNHFKNVVYIMSSSKLITNYYKIGVGNLKERYSKYKTILPDIDILKCFVIDNNDDLKNIDKIMKKKLNEKYDFIKRSKDYNYKIIYSGKSECIITDKIKEIIDIIEEIINKYSIEKEITTKMNNMNL